jgi:Cu-Zn family superoxide dismutase
MSVPAILAIALLTLAGCGGERREAATANGLSNDAATGDAAANALANEAAVAAGLGAAAPFAILGPSGEARGFASFTSDGQRTTIKVNAEGLPAGVHGIHLHAVGRCDGPKFESAGAHWNPAGKQHGKDNPQGAHVGDLPNLTAGADGKASASFAIDGDMADADGTALVIHAKADDYKTDPSGNSGARIACAVLTTAGR